MKPLIKWPGGKSSEICNIIDIIPIYDRYIEPFLGGGALYFHLQPQQAVLNDISTLLTSFYQLVKTQDVDLHNHLVNYNQSLDELVLLCERNNMVIIDLFQRYNETSMFTDEINEEISRLCVNFCNQLAIVTDNELILNLNILVNEMVRMVKNKFSRTVVNNARLPFGDNDLMRNLTTGFVSGYYMYFRSVYNDIALNRINALPLPYVVANFYFIREYCYGSMFRYNKSGEFNIPYGGMSYNCKNMIQKIDKIFNHEVAKLFESTEIHCNDFEVFLNSLNLTERDFIFLDPPYDSEFSEYDGNSFTMADQERLASFLANTRAQFILVIKNTPLIQRLYNVENGHNIIPFGKMYTYNIRQRNERNVEHLIITNIPV